MIELSTIRTSEEEGYTAIEMNIVLGSEIIGSISLMDSESDTYLERIDIYESYRNQGHGTEALSAIKSMYDTVYLAPDNADAKRLYDRVCYEVTNDDALQYDNGYGVYRL